MEGQNRGALYQPPATFSIATSKTSLILTRKESLEIYASGGETGLNMAY